MRTPSRSNSTVPCPEIFCKLCSALARLRRFVYLSLSEAFLRFFSSGDAARWTKFAKGGPARTAKELCSSPRSVRLKIEFIQRQDRTRCVLINLERRVRRPRCTSRDWKSQWIFIPTENRNSAFEEVMFHAISSPIIGIE